MFIGDVIARSSTISDATTAGSNSQVTRNEFLRLLVAQLQHQDPLNPTADIDFLAQLAQFSSLEQLMNANQGLDRLAENQLALNSLGAVSFIGREVTVPGDTIRIDGGVSDSINFQLSENASTVSIEIRDAYGRLVRTLDLGSRAAGDQQFSFDGRDGTGAALPDGTYRYAVAAQTQDGRQVPVILGSVGVVTGVTVGPDGSTHLLLGDREVSLRDVIAVREVSATEGL